LSTHADGQGVHISVTVCFLFVFLCLHNNGFLRRRYHISPLYQLMSNSCIYIMHMHLNLAWIRRYRFLLCKWSVLLTTCPILQEIGYFRVLLPVHGTVCYSMPPQHPTINLRVRLKTFLFYVVSCIIVKESKEYLYSAIYTIHILKALRHGSHSFTCKLHHACLSFVSVHQMAPPLTEVADILLQLTTHVSTSKGRKAELAWLADQ